MNKKGRKSEPEKSKEDDVSVRADAPMDLDKTKNEYVRAFNDTVFRTELSAEKRKLLVDTAKSGLSKIEECAEDVPIFGFFIKSGRLIVDFGLGIYHMSIAIKQMVFARKFFSGDISEKKKAKVRKMLDEGKWTEKDTLTLLNYVDESREYEKIEWAGSLFVAFFNERIMKDELFDYLELADKVFLRDILILEDNWDRLDSYGYIRFDNSVCPAMYRLGINNIGEQRTPNDDNVYGAWDYDRESYFYYDEYGKKFVNIIMGKPDMPENKYVKDINFRTAQPPSSVIDKEIGAMFDKDVKT